MKIGEFAKICDTKITILRHYDRQGLLKPEYIDRFTGYRYYSKDQIPVFFRIAVLKKVGFSLSEISKILSKIKSDKDILAIFDKKESELKDMLQNLDEARKTILGAEYMINVIFNETENNTQAKSSKIEETDFKQACEIMEKTIVSQDYQRISNYKSYGGQDSRLIEAVCDVIKLRDDISVLDEDINIPFENDETVIGKWQIIGEYAVKQDFFANKFCDNPEIGNMNREIYFLPNGECYWCYGWTKGKLLIDTGDSTSVNNYEIESYNGMRYMFISFKSYIYRRGGKPTILVLRQIDNKEYTSKEIARKDNIDIPFVDDKCVIGKWKVFDFIINKEDFTTERINEKSWFFSEIEFFENGKCISRYGDEIIDDSDLQVWTKGYLLRKWNSTACKYEIRNINGTDYLIIEWKSGDYRWGGFDTDYYVFTRV